MKEWAAKELKDDIERYVQDEALRARMDSVTETERAHGRIETRSAYTGNDVSWQPEARRRPALTGTYVRIV